MKTVRFLSLILALLLVLPVLLAGCKENAPEPENVSDKAVPLFAEALENYGSRAFKSLATADVTIGYLELDKDGIIVETEQARYRQYFSCVHRADLSPRELYYRSSILRAIDGGAETVPTFCFDATVTGNDCLYTAALGQTETRDFSTEQLAHIGVTSLGGQTPRSANAIDDGSEILIRFTFSEEQCLQTQKPFADLINSFLLGSSPELTVSDLEVTIHLSSADRTLRSFDLTFEGYVTAKQNIYLTYVYSETFDCYGTTEREIAE